MRKFSFVIITLLMLLCFSACNSVNSIICVECGFENPSMAKFCSECGASISSANNNSQEGSTDVVLCQHSWGIWQEKVAATCTTTGIQERACLKCSYKETAIITTLGHLWGIWQEKVATTCTNNGAEERVCLRCSYKENKTITALGHTTSTGVCGRCNQRMGWTAEELQNIVQIHDVYVSDIDSAEGVDMRISWTNTSNKNIKYIHFYVVPYNAVGDPMYCEIRDYSRFDAYVTGPCEPGYKGYYKVGDIYYGNLWENSWYNGSISTIKLVGIKIIYMDGSIIDITEKDIPKTIVKFPSLKEGYDIDETLLVYFSDTGEHHLVWSVEYLGVSVRPDLNIDVRIVNSNNAEVFSCGYYAESECFVESTIFGLNKWVIKTTMNDDEIKSGISKEGTLHFHIWSDDGAIDLGWLSLPIDNLPTK